MPLQHLSSGRARRLSVQLASRALETVRPGIEAGTLGRAAALGRRYSVATFTFSRFMAPEGQIALGSDARKTDANDEHDEPDKDGEGYR